MKRTLVASILGLAGSVAASYGQGAIQFNNYIASGAAAAPYTGQVFYATDPALGALSGQPVNDTAVEVQLFYAGGTASSFASTAAFLAAATPGVTTFMVGNVGPTAAPAGGGGWYTGPVQTLANFPTTPTYTFAVEAWETTGQYGGATYATSKLEGTSGLWQESAAANAAANGIQPAANNPTGFLGGPPTMTIDLVTTTPEPSILALGGLGAGLLALRRRK